MKAITPSLAVADVDASVRFYADVLGFEPIMTLPGEEGKTVHASVSRGDAQMMLGALRPEDATPSQPLGKGVILYASVGDDEDIDILFAHAKGQGATVVQEPTDQFWGHRDWAIADPDGYQIYVSKETRRMSEREMREEMVVGAGAD